MQNTKECTQCGACLNACPVFRLHKGEEFSPKAKQMLISKAWQGPELNWKKVMELVGQCACCERCKWACARQLSVPEALSEARARHPRWQQYFWKEWIAHGKILWSVAARMAPCVPNGLLPKKLGILHAAALAMQSPPAITSWLGLSPAQSTVLHGRSFLLFGGCTATRLRPGWMEKSAHIISTLGGSLVDSSALRCCGGTYEHAGMPDSARQAALHNIAVWKAHGKPAVVVFCASCLHSLRHYAHMNLMPEDEAKDWTASLTPLSTLLQGATVEKTPNAPASYAYHSPCHWGNDDMDLLWLQKVLPGMHKGTTACCGFGGVLKMLNPELSKTLAESCWNGFEEQKSNETPHSVITGCSGCTMQLNAHAPQGAYVYHWLDVWEG